MKKSVIILLVSCLAACSKPATDPNGPQCLAATFYFDTYQDTTWRVLLKTETWHLCAVCDALLETYKKLDPDIQVCPGEPKRQRLVLGIDNCKKSAK